MRVEILIFATLLAATTALSIKPRKNEIKAISNKRQEGEARIIGGEDAPLHRFPYHVALYSELYKVWLNGALITDRWVITTAYVAIVLPSENAFALLGAQVPKDTEVTQQRIEIDKKIVHESHDGVYVNDIALLRLKSAAELDEFVSPIILASFNSPDFHGARLVLSGFGYTTYGGTQSQILRYIVLNGISNSVCKRMLSPVNDGTLCVETTGRKGACLFDHGGPLVDVERGLLVGLMADYWACWEPPVRPDLFTRVSYYNKWIIDNIQNNSDNVK